MRTISDALVQAQLGFNRVPLMRVHAYRPGYPDDVLDLSPYILSNELTLPPQFSAGYINLTVMNPGNFLTNNVLFRPDYVIIIYMGYLINGSLQFQKMGTFYMDEPQRNFTVNPPQNEVVIQARDGVKLLMEKHFTVLEWISFEDMSVQQAIDYALSFVTLAGEPMTAVYDTDQNTLDALSASVSTIVVSAQDQVNNAYDLIKTIIGVSKLEAFFNEDGALRIGMMDGLDSASSYGGILAATRPIFGRNHRRSGREHHNWIHVEGDTVYADVYDQDNIDDIGRVKYFFIDDPEIDTNDKALRRARQELDLSARFREQPDITVPWMLDLERRDIITIDDKGASGLALSTWRVEDIRYNYQSGKQPVCTMQLGLGLPTAPKTEEVGVSI